jgi:hypothetical protein
VSVPFSLQHKTVCSLTQLFSLINQTQEIQLWGDHGENFDEAGVIEKSKKEIVVALFSGFASGSFRGKYKLLYLNAACHTCYLEVVAGGVENSISLEEWSLHLVTPLNMTMK